MANEPLVTVAGNLVADPEPRVSQAGKSWVTFRIASTPRVRDKQSGDWSDGEALWLGCRAYGAMADNIASSLSKGAAVVVQGRLTQRSYEKDGQQRTSLELEVEEIGASLKFATVQATRSQTRQGGASGSNGGGQGDWAQPSSNGAPAAFQGGGGFDDEQQPF